jgi:hypothetical protein
MKWNVCQYAGAKFAFIRAGSCTNVGGYLYTDDQFERNANLAPDFFPVGFYWYFRPQHDPIKQADYFVDLIRDKRAKLPPVMDLENAGGLNPSEVTGSAVRFAARIYQRMSVWPILYSRAEWLNKNTLPATQWSVMDLFIARYNPLLDHPWSDGNCIPRDWKVWKFWQISARNGRGAEFGAESASIDQVIFNGNEQDFELYIGSASGDQLARVVGSLAVSLRSGPAGKAIGATWKGATWPVLSRTPDGKYYRVEAWILADKMEVI